MSCPDYALGTTFYFFFNTQKSDGTPITLAGTPSLCARIDGNDTEITTGLTLVVDSDSKTGLHKVTVVATSGNGYSSGTNVSIEIAAGTVNGISQVGVEVYEFTIEKQVAKLANAAQGGAAAVLTLERIVVASATSNEPAVKLTGNGTGAGLLAQGGASGNGITGAAGATQGTGISGLGSGTGHGIAGEGSSGGDGIAGYAPGSGRAGIAGYADDGDGIRGLSTMGGADISGDITGNITGNLSGSVASVTAGVTLADDAITAAKYDESTAFPVKANDAGSTQIARVGADGDTLETLSDQLDAKASQASVDDLPTNAELATALAGADDAVLAAIAALNNLSQADVRTAVGLATNNLDTQLDALPTALENADALLKRDWSAVTGEATRSALNALRFLRNKWSIAGGTLTVTEEDDATPAWTGAVTQTAGNPVSEIDPA